MKYKILVAALIAAASMNAQAVAPNVVDMTVTGGTFVMTGVGGGSWGALPGVDLVDGYTNLGNLFNFFGGPVQYYTAAHNDGSTNTVAGLLTGGPVPSAYADAVNGTLTADLSSLIAEWNGTEFVQGNTATGTWNSVTGVYSISWSRLIVGGPFSGFTGSYTMTGIANAVPEPETYAMMLAGLGMVGFVGMRRKSKQA